MSEPLKLKCKNCGCDNHPHYDCKYDGFCLDCVNAKADQHLDKIAELERQLATAQARIAELESQLAECRQTNSRLNRRVQQQESPEALEKRIDTEAFRRFDAKVGESLAVKQANYHAARQGEKNAELKRLLKDAQSRIATLEAALKMLRPYLDRPGPCVCGQGMKCMAHADLAKLDAALQPDARNRGEGE